MVGRGGRMERMKGKMSKGNYNFKGEEARESYVLMVV